MAKIRRNLTGMKFGKLTAVEYMKTDKYRNALWKCKCDCGNYLITKGTLLTNGKVVSCGQCENKYNLIEPQKTEIKTSLVGKKFGRLLAIEERIHTKEGEKEKATDIYYLCRCDCGNEIEVSRFSLLAGRTKSCGCLQREKVSNTLFRLDTSKIGTRVGKLTVLSYDTEKKKWKCQCDCGNITYVRSLNGNTKSCGCLKRERRKTK